MAKVLKVLKVLNFSGTGKFTIFTCTFTGDDPHFDPPLGACPHPLTGGKGDEFLGNQG